MSLQGSASEVGRQDFRRSYSVGAIRGAFWASVFGGASYSLFLAVAWISEDVSFTGVVVRTALVALLIASANFFASAAAIS